jgi:hypothetical protein
MAYEIYSKQVVRVSSPMITLNGRGRIVLNVAATKVFHDAGVETAFLLWDLQGRKFAIQGTRKRDQRTVNVRYSSNNKWAAISAKGFLEEIGHDMSTTKAYPAIWNANEGMFEVSLSGQEELPIEAPKSEEPRRKLPLRVPAARQASR